MYPPRRRIPTNDRAGLPKDNIVLPLQSHVSLSDLTTIGALKAGSLAALARDTLRAVAQGAARTRAVVPIRSAAMPASKVDQGLPRIMLRGAERC
jgi:hypothetical protein